MSYDGRLLAGVSVLAAVVEGGSFVKAAEVLGLTPSGVSRAVSRLEGRVGVRLLDRTTRSLRLTDEGARFYEAVIPHLDGIEEASILASGSAAVVRGRLRVNADPFFSRLVLGPRLVEFLERYPELEVEVMTRDEIGELVADGVDVAFRFGPQKASSLIARLLLETRILTVATPRYLEMHGRPKTPLDLARHFCIQYRDPSSGMSFEWEFRRDKQSLPVTTSGRLQLSDVGTMLEACLSSLGIAQVMALGVQDLLDSGRLVDLFPDWPGETFPLYAVYPSRHQPPAKVRVFIDFCMEISNCAMGWRSIAEPGFPPSPARRRKAA